MGWTAPLKPCYRVTYITNKTANCKDSRGCLARTKRLSHGSVHFDIQHGPRYSGVWTPASSTTVNFRSGGRWLRWGNRPFRRSRRSGFLMNIFYVRTVLCVCVCVSSTYVMKISFRVVVIIRVRGYGGLLSTE